MAGRARRPQTPTRAARRDPLEQSSGTIVIAVSQGGPSLGVGLMMIIGLGLGLLEVVRVRFASMLPALLPVVQL